MFRPIHLQRVIKAEAELQLQKMIDKDYGQLCPTGKDSLKRPQREYELHDGRRRRRDPGSPVEPVPSPLQLVHYKERKPAELLEVSSVIRDKIPVIRRFTGGGTVIVDHGTIFVTYICNKDAFPHVQPYPKPIMRWSSLIYKNVFQGIGDFSLRENDYVFGNRKFGGNAQSITKNRWIHHTSFLWDYDMSNMAYLKLPKRAPEYRKARCHLEFICRLKDYLQRSEFIDRTIDALDNHFSVKSTELEEIESPSNAEFKPSSRLLDAPELQEAAVNFQPQKISVPV